MTEVHLDTPCMLIHSVGACLLTRELRRPLFHYAVAVGAKRDTLTAGVRQLHADFCKVAADETPDSVVRMLLKGSLPSSRYPYAGIDWAELSGYPSFYAAFVLSVREVRALLPAGIVEQNRVAVHVSL